MAAPSVTVRGVPAGIQIPDGYQSLFAFNRKPTLGFWEKQVKPPGIDGGEPIDNTTMLNTVWHVMRARKLKKRESIVLQAAFDPSAITDYINLVNVEDAGTVIFPDGTTETYWCYLQKIEFGELKIGEMPELTATIVVTNYDPTAHVEAGSVLASITGT